MIYVVTSGCHSDYSIEAIFDSKEKARSFLEYYKENSRWFNEYVRIEEYEMNQHYDKISRGYLFYFIRMKPDGNVIKIETEAPSTHKETVGLDTKHNYMIRVWGKNKDHAIKVANEKRLQYKASIS